MKDYLVFVRAGEKSLHPYWLADDPERNWDLCVSWYCEPRPEGLAEYYVSSGSNKFDALDAFSAEHLVQGTYRYVLAVDDDIAFRPGDISRFFSLCDEHALYLAQPSLRWGTHANHDVSLNNPFCIIRRTRFVEVMVPCFSQAALVRLQPTFRINHSTWGLDYAWASLLAGEQKIAVVDAIQVEHTKAVSLDGGAFYRKLAAAGVDPVAEYAAIKSSYPRFGSLASESSGHLPILPLPDWLATPLIRLFEGIKKRAHARLQRNGSQ